MTQFAMVEELASLVKENLYSKHLVLSVEEKLVNFLDSDSSSNGKIELEPMNSYNRLLMHRLADIFGFSHESVGEGEDRHIVMERCPESSVPSILVSDILEQYDDEESRTNSYEKSRAEELASLVKDNLSSKHLLISVEEKMVEFVDSDTNYGETLELEPMSKYNRHLVHRLADRFGFYHESFGEGDDRRLVLEKSSETSEPSFLVSDILRHYDEPHSPSAPQQLLLRRSEASPALKTESNPTPNSLEEREAAYLAARERIFSEEKEPTEQRPRNVPAVARRMIAHALGQRINHASNSVSLSQSGQIDESNTICDGDNKVESDTQSPGKKSSSPGKSKVAVSHRPGKNWGSGVDFGRERNGVDHKKEHVGAAKRMFAQALGKPPGVAKSDESKG